jgi:hypothetical protein
MAMVRVRCGGGWVVTLLTVAVCALPAAAGVDEPAKADTPARTVGVDVGRLRAAVEGLGLTGDARAKAEAILKRAEEELPKGSRESAAAVLQSAEADLAALLDEDQKILFHGKLKAAAAAGEAQKPGADADRAGRPGLIAERIKAAAAAVGLSDEQKPKVDAVVADVRKRMEELRAAGQSPETREKLRAIRDDMMGRLRKILSPEQMTKFEAAMRQTAPAGPAGVIQRLRDVADKLELSDEEKAKVKTALDQARTKFQAGQQARETPREIMQELRTELAKTLTREQMEQLRAVLPPPAGGGRKKVQEM